MSESSLIRGVYGIADVSGAPGRTELEVASAFLEGGVSVLQLRMKGQPRELVRAVLAELVPLAASFDCALVLNDDPELAAEFDGVGVHLGQEDMDPAEARALLGPGRLIGWSTHNADQVQRAGELGVDYVGFGPVFTAAGKHLAAGDEREPMAAVGLDSLSAIVARATVPVVAIGGISQARLASVLKTGAAAAAVISAVATAVDPTQAARELVAIAGGEEGRR